MLLRDNKMCDQMCATQSDDLEEGRPQFVKVGIYEYTKNFGVEEICRIG
jgi:hypothetical protein